MKLRIYLKDRLLTPASRGHRSSKTNTVDRHSHRRSLARIVRVVTGMEEKFDASEVMQ